MVRTWAGPTDPAAGQDCLHFSSFDKKIASLTWPYLTFLCVRFAQSHFFNVEGGQLLTHYAGVNIKMIPSERGEAKRQLLVVVVIIVETSGEHLGALWEASGMILGIIWESFRDPGHPGRME